MSEAESRVTDWVQSQQRTQQHPQQADPDQVMALLEVDRLRLKLGQLLQEGTFGRVYQGTLLRDGGGGEGPGESDVAIKTVAAGSSAAQREGLVREATRLHGAVSVNHLALKESLLTPELVPGPFQRAEPGGVDLGRDLSHAGLPLGRGQPQEVAPARGISGGVTGVETMISY